MSALRLIALFSLITACTSQHMEDFDDPDVAERQPAPQPDPETGDESAEPTESGDDVTTPAPSDQPETEPEAEPQPDCEDGAHKTALCPAGLYKHQICVAGEWQDSQCIQCEDDEAQELACWDGTLSTRTCVEGFWTEWSDCPEKMAAPSCGAGQVCCEPAPGGGCLVCAGGNYNCP